MLVISHIFCSKIYIPHTEIWVNLSTWCIQWVFWPFCRDYQRACIVHQMGWNQSPSICLIFWQKAASILLYIGYKASTPLISQTILTEKRAKHHKTCFHKYFMKNKRSSKEGSLEVEHSRAKCKSATETAAPRNAFFVVERNRFVKNVKRTASEITYSKGIPQKFSES